MIIDYKFNFQGKYREICSEWNLTFRWLISERGSIAFNFKTIFIDCKEKKEFNFSEDLLDKYFLYNILLLFFSICELIICVLRLWESYRNTKLAKMEIEFIDENSEINNEDDNKLEEENLNSLNEVSINKDDINEKILQIRKMKINSKWDLLTFTDKLAFFNLWLVLFVLGNIFQIYSVLINIFNPIYAENNMLFNAFSCMFAWFSVGYFIDFNKEYSIFNKILKSSFSQFIIIFFLFFIFFFISIIWKIVTFCKSEIGIGLYTSAIWLFSFIFNDRLFQSIYQIRESERTVYFLLSILFFYILFTILFLRIFISLIEEVYEKVNMQNKYSSLENKINFSDYLLQQAKQIKNEDDNSNSSKLSTQNQINPKNNFMMCDVFVKVILDRDFEINEKITEFLNKQEGKIKRKIIEDSPGLEFFMNKKFEKFQKNFLSGKMLNDIIRPDKTNDPFDLDLKLGKTDWKNKKLENYFDYLDDIFKGINSQINGISYILIENKNFKKFSKFERGLIKRKFSKKTDSILFIIKKFLNRGNSEKLFLRLGTSGRAIFELESE